MPKIISSVDLNRMRSIEKKKKLVNMEYMQDRSHEVTKFIAELFFNSESTDPNIKKKGESRLKVLNHTIALPYKIATTKAKYFGKPQTNLEVMDLKEQVISYVYGGYSVFAIDETDEDGKPIINKYDPEQYIKGIYSDKLVTYLKDDNNNTYCFIKEFPHGEDDKGVVLNLLYEITGEMTAGVTGKKVGLDTLEQTAHLEERDDFDTEESLIFTVHDYKLTNTDYGTPQLGMVETLIDQMNIELVNIKDQFMKHLQAKLAIQGVDASKMPTD